MFKKTCEPTEEDFNNIKDFKVVVDAHGHVRIFGLTKCGSINEWEEGEWCLVD